MKIVLFRGLALASTLLMGCATIGRIGGGYRDSTLSNLNPAPASLTPPDYGVNSDKPAMDDTYLNSQADYHYTIGETYSHEGQASRAVEEFKATLIYDPKSIHVRLALAREYVRMGLATEAVEQGEIAVEMAPDNLDARMLLGGLYAGLKMFAPAREQFQAILNRSPGHPEAAVYLGALLAEDRKYEEAVSYFETLSANKEFKDPEKAHYYIGRVRSEQGESHYGQAKTAFSKALSLKPEYPEAALSLAMILRSEKKDGEMVKLLRSYQEKFGPEREMARQLSHYFLEKEDYDRALEQLEVLDGFERDNLNIKIQISLILIGQKKYETAAQRLEDVLMQAPDSDKVRYYLGMVYEEIGKTGLAIDHYRHIPPTSSYFAEGVAHTAQLFKNSGRLTQAVDTVEEALRIQNEVPQLYAFYAALLDEQKQHKKALKMLTEVVDRFPTNTQLRFFLGTMYDRVGASKETVLEMKKVLEQDKDHVQALNYLAYTYAELGRNLEEARSLAARALELAPTDGYILDTVGWIHFKCGEIEQAIKYLEAAFKAKADEAIIAEHLGDAYLRNQMWQKAQRMYQRAVQLEDDTVRHGKIEEKLANIRRQTQSPARLPASSVGPFPQ